MKILKRTQRIPPRTDPTPLLTIEEQLEPVKIELIQEVEADGQPINEIVLRVPQNRDMLDAQLTPERTPDTTYKILAKACDGVPPETIEALHPRDLDYLTRHYWAYQE